jgi:hypothetical protein
MKTLNAKIFFVIICSLFQVNLFNAQGYIFYLHGKIIENKGANAVDSVNGYGAYRYLDIIDSLSSKGKFRVISEVRQKNTDVKAYAQKVKRQIDSLLNKKVEPQKITVVGASKGSLIAMYVSLYMKNKDINYVFMAACGDDLLDSAPELEFYGNILSIYEKSDFAGSCQKFKERSKNINHFKEIELNTGLKHGFLYKPLSGWVHPAIKWANGDYK